MRNYVGDQYKTVGLCGSFRKHLGDIAYAYDTFTSGGFRVIAPDEGPSTKNPDDEFVILDADNATEPIQLESDYIRRPKKADVVYVCNPGGYVGGSVMMELGHLAGRRTELYFSATPNEPVLQGMVNKGGVVPVEDQVASLTHHNSTFDMGEWPDASMVQQGNFSFREPA